MRSFTKESKINNSLPIVFHWAPCRVKIKQSPGSVEARTSFDNFKLTSVESERVFGVAYDFQSREILLSFSVYARSFRKDPKLSFLSTVLIVPV